MSSMRITYGVVAAMVIPVKQKDEYEELQDWLEEIDSPLGISYSRDVIFYRAQDGEETDFDLIIVDKDKILKSFYEELERANIPVVEGTEKIFFDRWYDGCDSNHSGIELSDLREEGE